jgi:DNA-binding NarL/FixJ family response regulator
MELHAGPPITCVIGDDHAALRQGLIAFLQSEPDIRVVGEATTGEEALALAQRRLPDVLVLDVHMANADGVEICRQAGALGLATRVILYTGSEDVDLLDAALEAGACGYVVKSGPPGDLVRAVRTAMEGRVYVDASLAGALFSRRSAPQRQLLSAREEEVVHLLADGNTTDETARELFLSPATVRGYTESAMRKVEARNRVHLIAKSVRMGLLAPVGVMSREP